MPDQPSAQPSLKPRRWLRRLWLALAIIIIPPLVLIVAMSVIFSAHAVRLDQLQPRPELLTIKPRTSTAAPKTVDQLVTSPSQKEAVAILRILYSKQFDFNLWFGAWDYKNPSPGHLAWVAKNRDFIDNIKKVAADGVPMPTYEQAAALNDENLDQLKNSTLQQNVYVSTYSKMLLADARRCREAGDLGGAADALIAVYRLAHSTAMPFESSRGSATYIQSLANKELADWLAKNSMPADLAARIRDQLVKSPITLADARRSIELNYRLDRAKYCKLLNGSFLNLTFDTMRNYSRIHRALNQPYREYRFDPEYMFGSFVSQPLQTTTDLIQGAQRASRIKANASSNVDRFDAYYASVLGDLERNQPVAPPKAFPEMASMISYEAEYAVTCNNLAQLRALTMALNTISTGSPGSEPDPYANEPIKMVHTNEATLFYSVGPDRTDDHGLLSYDPTNGTFRPTPGDIVLTIPKPSE